jgi:hypothetical protein
VMGGFVIDRLAQPRKVERKAALELD